MDLSEIRDTCRRLSNEQTGFFIEPIPESKGVDARNTLSIPPSEKLIALIGWTLLGGAKEALVVTENAIYWIDEAGGRSRVNWYELVQSELAPRAGPLGFRKRITFSNGAILTVEGNRTSAFQVICELAARQWQRVCNEARVLENRGQSLDDEKRDADTQDTPYTYRCGGHPNRTLALRYGIANVEGPNEKTAQREQIDLRKIEKLHGDSDGTHYLAELPSFGNRKVRVVIKPGTDYILTFYPMSESWFTANADLEEILKDNPTFSLKELATFHVQAVLRAK